MGGCSTEVERERADGRIQQWQWVNGVGLPRFLDLQLLRSTTRGGCWECTSGVECCYYHRCTLVVLCTLRTEDYGFTASWRSRNTTGLYNVLCTYQYLLCTSFQNAKRYALCINLHVEPSSDIAWSSAFTWRVSVSQGGLRLRLACIWRRSRAYKYRYYHLD